MAIKWHESLAVGVAEIDGQHQELFRRLHRLLAACNRGKGKESVRELVAFLQQYVIEHFAAEEKLQRQSGYPDYAAHRAKHAEFIRTAGELKFTLEEQGPTLPFIIAVNKVVVDWLVQHISKMDKDLGRYLSAKGTIGLRAKTKKKKGCTFGADVSAWGQSRIEECEDE